MIKDQNVKIFLRGFITNGIFLIVLGFRNGVCAFLELCFPISKSHNLSVQLTASCN